MNLNEPCVEEALEIFSPVQTADKSSDNSEDTMAVDLPNNKDEGAMVVDLPNDEDTMVVGDIVISMQAERLSLFFKNSELLIIFSYPSWLT